MVFAHFLILPCKKSPPTGRRECSVDLARYNDGMTETSSPPRRRWFRFRLRTLLIVLAVTAVPLAWVANERRQSWYEAQIAEYVGKIPIPALVSSFRVYH